MKTKHIIFFILFLAIILGLFFYFFNKNGQFETYEIQKKDFEEIIEVSGKVIPAQEINLSFEITGKIKTINVDIGDAVEEGDILVELDSLEILGELNETIANLESERAKLSEVSGNSLSENKLENSRQNLLKIIRKAYVTADDVIRNNIDPFFEDPNTITPEFSESLTDYFIRQDLNESRYQIGRLLSSWEQEVNSKTSETIGLSDAEISISNLGEIEDILAIISSGGGEFEPRDGITQSQIDSYVSGISSSRQTVASLIIEINGAVDSLRDVEAEIPILQASINSASASVEKLSAKVNKFVITAPFDGIITEQKIELGQVVASNESVLSMISNQSLEVEAFVPEINIAGVNIDDSAIMKFDAFGTDKTFEAYISHIDPRETIKDGVTTYRILLDFKKEYPEIKSGMTNDVTITKTIIPNTVVIPRYLIQSDSEGDFVEIYNNGEKQRKNIILGRGDGRGNVQIVSGINDGEQIVIPK